MRMIGYWMVDLRWEDFPLPQELVGEMDESLREEVCRYLENGHVFERYRGYSACRFRCGVESKVMGSMEFTDGEWAWPEGLVHYVRHHGVVLPEEFLATVRVGGMAAEVSSWPDASLDFWLAWANERRSPGLRRYLGDALEGARVEAVKQIDLLIEETRLLEGEGTVLCQWEGCGRPVLAGRAICAWHFLEPQLNWRTIGLYRVPDLQGW